MKKNKLLLLIISLVIIFSISTCVLADGIPGIGSGNELGELKKPVEDILGYVQWVGYAIAIGMLIYIGIKFVTSSASGRADMKSAMIKYIIGAIIIAGATGLSTAIFSLAKELQ